MTAVSDLKNRFVIFLVGFFGFVGFSIAIPVFSVMFGSSQTPDFIAVLGNKKELYLGFLLAMYPLGQLIAFPLIGRLSDFYGRRPVLLTTIFLVIPATLLTAWAIKIESLTLLFFGRFLSGFFEASNPISNAALADLSKHKTEKAINFGYLLSFMSAGYLIGPLFGGFLAHVYNYSAPFLFSAVISFLMFLIAFFKFKETLIEKRVKKLKFDRNLIPLFGLFSFRKLSYLFTGNFLIYLTSQLFYIFLPLFLVRTYHFNSIHVGLSEAYIAFFTLFAPLVHKRASLYFPHKRILLFSALFLAFNISLVLLVDTTLGIMVALFPVGFLIAMTFTYSQALISEKAHKKEQGEAISLNESLVVLAEIMASFLGGFLAGTHLMLPMILAIVFALLCFIWLLFPLKTVYRKS